MTKLTIGSLFAGIGGLELGLERAGMGPVEWQVELDPFCRKVLAKHWPDARRFEDVRKVGSRELDPVDVICGGFPCQDISAAGAGAGLGGERSGLWFEFLRIIREMEPRFVIVENVSALLIRGMGTVLGGLAESGYDVEWDCIPAQAVGAPHRRDRLFLVARRISDPIGDPLRLKPERGEGSAQAADGGNAEPSHLGGEVANPGGGRLGESEAREVQLARRAEAQRSSDFDVRREVADAPIIPEREPNDEACTDSREDTRTASRCGSMRAWPPSPGDLHAWGRMPDEAQPAICRVAHGVPRGMDRDRLKALGNAVVPQVAEVIGRAVLEAADHA